MLEQRVRILDVDGSVARQSALLEGLKPGVDIVPLRHLERHLRFMSSRAARRRFEQALKAEQRHWPTFYGSGDFHHLSAALVAQWKTPLSLVVFDGHPDWDVTSPWPCCGCWVNEVLALPNVRKVVVLGLGKTDLHGWHVLRGNLKAVRQGKLELFPYRWQHSKTMLAPSAVLPCARLRAHGLRTNIAWQTIARQGLPLVMQSVIERLPTEQVYVSIDKDCLLPQHAVTNWEKGALSLSALSAALIQLGEQKEIVGADVTGEWSQGPIENWLFRVISRADHPGGVRPSAQDLRVNEQTNIVLADILLGLAQLKSLPRHVSQPEGQKRKFHEHAAIFTHC